MTRSAALRWYYSRVDLHDRIKNWLRLSDAADDIREQYHTAADYTSARNTCATRRWPAVCGSKPNAFHHFLMKTRTLISIINITRPDDPGLVQRRDGCCGGHVYSLSSSCFIFDIDYRTWTRRAPSDGAAGQGIDDVRRRFSLSRRFCTFDDILSIDRSRIFVVVGAATSLPRYVVLRTFACTIIITDGFIQTEAVS